MSGLDPEVDRCAITLHERFCVGTCVDEADHVDRLGQRIQAVVEDLFEDEAPGPVSQADGAHDEPETGDPGA